ncbi:MAG: hypothetical protein ACYDHH_17900 [Solirubrobacteraceae bacterium]
MSRSVVKLPADLDIYEDFDVYVNGVPQRPGVDFEVEHRALVFDRALRKDQVSGWRWFLGAWGIGTYRQDDTVDIRYEVGDEQRLAHDLRIAPADDDPANDE